MPIKSEWIHYQNQTGYLALPQPLSGPLPAVVVIQEIWGVNEHIEDVTRRIAAAGYAALAPDLLAVNGQRPAALANERIAQLMAWGDRMPPGTLFNPEAREAALAGLAASEQALMRETVSLLLGGLGKTDELMALLRSAVRHLREQQPETRGQKVACVGFCMGGGLSALLSCEEPELGGAAMFYGRSPSADKVAAGHCPVIGFYAGEDSRVNAGLPDFERAMQAAGRPFEHHVYPGAHHAFFNDTRPTYQLAAARDAFARLLHFFLQVLTG